MLDPILFASAAELFFDAWQQLAQFINGLDVWQWGILSSCGVLFGFLCLKGSNFS